LKEEQFIKINTNIWRELEDLSSLIDKKGIKALPSKDVKRFLYVFRQCSHHLAYARTHFPESRVVSYLNDLTGKSHSHVYGVNKLTPVSLFSFPRLLKKYRVYILISFAIFLSGFLTGLFAVMANRDNALIFLQQSMIEGIKNGSAGNGQWNNPLVSSFIMFNNISVSLKAFVFGITLGIGTIYVLFFNGTMLGSLTAVVYYYGKPLNFWSLILPHGIMELTAIFISGAAGIIIAKSLLLPGEHTRLHSLVNGSKKAVSLVPGIIFMLVIAGIIEGFFTPMNISPVSKLLFAGFTGLLLSIYFSAPYLH
jgi:uncharacterized membrane protein SpoIIM required for sporulation